MIYIVLVFFIYLLYPYSKFEQVDDCFLKSKRMDVYCISVFLLFWGLLGLRSIHTGLDTEMYGMIFENLDYYDSFYKLYFADDAAMTAELGYCFFQWSVNFFFNYRGFLIFNAALMLIPVVYCIRKHSQKIWLSFLLFFLLNYLTWYMCAARQAVAVSFSLLAFFLYKDRKWKYALLSFAVAFLFHSTSIVVLPLFFVFRIFRGDKFIWITIVVTNIIGTSLLPWVLPYLRIDYADDVLNGSVGKVTYIGLLVLFMIISFFKNKYKMSLSMSYNMFASVIILWPLVDSLPAAFRIVLYFLIYLVFLIPEMLNQMNNSTERSFLLIVTLIICTIYLLNHIIFAGMKVLPYESIFDVSDKYEHFILK